MSRAFQLMGSEASELSIEEAFALALTDDTFHDVTFQGSDGVQVPANRTILGLRSPVFRKMLFGNFQEATKDTVNVDYPSAVVKSVVKYIHTNKVELLVELDAANSNAGDEIPEAFQEEFQTLLTLTAAAAYYSLPKFCNEVQKCLWRYFKAYPLLAFAVLEACYQEFPAISEHLKQNALSEVLKSLLDKDIDAKVLANFSQGAVESILINGKSVMSERHRFLLIDLWCRAGSNDPDRSSISMKLVKEHVNLQLMDPDDLSTSVTASGLVTFGDLFNAYQCQALRAKHEFKVPFAKKNTVAMYGDAYPQWNGAQSATFTNTRQGWQSDTVKCPIMVPGGTYTWTVAITGSQVRLGVGLSKPADNVVCNGFDGLDSPFYGAYSYGNLLGGTPKFGNGDTVTMTLDLRSEEPQGALFISVNSQPNIAVKEGMLIELVTYNSQGFVPAVSCGQSSVVIESFELL